MRVSVTAELPLDDICSSGQEAKNDWHQDWRHSRRLNGWPVDISTAVVWWEYKTLAANEGR